MAYGVCGVWLHTNCNEMEDEKKELVVFVCSTCIWSEGTIVIMDNWLDISHSKTTKKGNFLTYFSWWFHQNYFGKCLDDLTWRFCKNIEISVCISSISRESPRKVSAYHFLWRFLEKIQRIKLNNFSAVLCLLQLLFSTNYC